MKKTLAPLLSALLLVCAGQAMAQSTNADHASHHPATSAATASADLTAAEVRRVDKAAGKITLRHEAIKNLDMPAMTMVFQVRDAALLDKVQPGDAVRFTVDKINGAYVVLSIEPQPR